MPLSVDTLTNLLDQQLAQNGYSGYPSVAKPWATAYHQYASPAITAGAARGAYVSSQGLIEASIVSYGYDVFPEQLAAGISAYWLAAAWTPQNSAYNPGTTIAAPAPPLASALRAVFIKNTSNRTERLGALREIASVLHTYTVGQVKVLFPAKTGGGTSTESPA